MKLDLRFLYTFTINEGIILDCITFCFEGYWQPDVPERYNIIIDMYDTVLKMQGAGKPVANLL